MNTSKAKPFFVRCMFANRGALACNFRECWYSVLPTKKKGKTWPMNKELWLKKIESNIGNSKYLYGKLFDQK
jgi:hypothetical protein